MKMFGFVVYWFLAIAVIVTLVLWAAGVSYGSLEDCHDATCRVLAGNDRGTGVVFEISQGHVFVLTNAHVVGNSGTARCEFWKSGHQSRAIAGQVIMTGRGGVDAALIAIPESAFGGMLPKAIPIAPRGTVLQPGETIMSVGCAKAAWATGWQGHVLQSSDSRLHFLPVPANGRSGSAIFDAKGERIVGLLNARSGGDTEGMAVSLEQLYVALAPQNMVTPRPVPWRAGPQGGQQGPGDCGPNGCEPGRRGQPYNMPYRQEQDRRIERIEGRVWPTLPPPVVVAPPVIAPIVDVEIDVAPKEEAPEPSGPKPAGVVIALVLAAIVGAGVFYGRGN